MVPSPIEGLPRAAYPIVGDLIVSATLIIYDGGYYSLDGGATTSTDTIGPDTQIKAPAGNSITITLSNTSEVTAKLIQLPTVAAPSGGLTVVGSGIISLNNQTVTYQSAISGIYLSGTMTVSSSVTIRSVGTTNGFDLRGGYLAVSGGAVLEGEGVNRGFNIAGRNAGNNSIIMSSGMLIGRSMGTASSALVGVYCSGGISVTGGRIEGYGQLGTTALGGSVGVSYDQSHGGYPLSITNGQVIGSAEVGVYAGGPVVVNVNGVLMGTGGTRNISHGVQADNTYIVVNQGGRLEGTCGGSAYAGVIAVSNGIAVNGGQLTGVGGIHGVRVAGNSSILLVINGGTVSGTGSTYGVFSRNNITVEDSRLTGVGNSYGVYAAGEFPAFANGDITVTDGVVVGTGGRDGVYARGNITATDGVVEGFTVAYGYDTSYYGAVIANGEIRAADNGAIIENYSRIEYFDEVYQLPYQNGKNMLSYLNYSWSISAGTGRVESDPGGAGIRAIRSGSGTLTAIRARDVAGEVVQLDDSSSHTINIPVALEAGEITYTVTYNGNRATGGSVPIDINEYRENDPVTVQGNVGNLINNGFVFAGWSMNPTGGGTIYQAGGIFIMPAHNVILYAVWRAMTPSPTPPQPSPPMTCRCVRCSCCCRLCISRCVPAIGTTRCNPACTRFMPSMLPRRRGPCR